MGNSQDLCDTEINGDASREGLLEHGTSSISSDSRHRLFDSQSSIRQIRGGGKAADVILWKHLSLSLGIIIVATFAWLLYERSGLSFLSISSDVLFILIIIQFIRANSAAFLNKQLRPLPELVLSEEMVNNAAASFRVKINYFLLMAHDITLGKDFRLFFKVVVILWLLSVIGSYVSFFTLLYIGTIISITVPALCGKYKECVDKCTGVMKIHEKQLGYENPQEVTGYIVCANCQLANKPVDIEVPKAVLRDIVFEAVVRIPYDMQLKQVLANCRKL